MPYIFSRWVKTIQTNVGNFVKIKIIETRGKNTIQTILIFE